MSPELPKDDFADMAAGLFNDAVALEERLARMTRKQRRALGAKLRKQLRQDKKKHARKRA